jgi:hypothetical protein
MAGFESISNILGKFSPAQRLIALILLLLTIITVSWVQLTTSAKPECETVQQQLIQTQSQLTSTILSQSTFIQTIAELREQTFDLNRQISRRDSVISVLTIGVNQLKRLDSARRQAATSELDRLPIYDFNEFPVMMNFKKYNQIDDTLQKIEIDDFIAPDLDTIIEPGQSIDSISIITKNPIHRLRRVLGLKRQNGKSLLVHSN